MRKETNTVLQTDTQVFDVTIRNIRISKVGENPVPALEIQVRVGSPETDSPWGHQGLHLIIRKDVDVSVTLRDWKDLIELLPQAIMEHHL